MASHFPDFWDYVSGAPCPDACRPVAWFWTLTPRVWGFDSWTHPPAVSLGTASRWVLIPLCDVLCSAQNLGALRAVSISSHQGILRSGILPARCRTGGISKDSTARNERNEAGRLPPASTTP